MHTKKNTNRFKALSLIVCLCIMGISNLQAQTIWENPETPVMSYLQRMAQKGKINFQDIIQPVSRKQIETALQNLEQEGLVEIAYGAIRILDLEGLRSYEA